MIKEQVQRLVQKVVSKGYDKPFVVIFPHHPNRRAFITYLLNEYDAPVYYYAASQNDTDMASYLWNLAASPVFSQAFQDTVQNSVDQSDNPQDWADAFASALDKLESGVFTLVLDDIDVIQYSGDDYHTFFEHLGSKMPRQAQIVINGRELNRFPWVKLIEDGVGMTIGDEVALGEGGFFNTASNRGVVEFYSLSGDIRVLTDGFQVHTWDGALPRNLCYYFIDKERVTRKQIFEDFWPHLGVKEATNVFHVTKRKISEKLGYDITNYSGGFYAPANDVDVYYDARELEYVYDSAMVAPELATAAKWYHIVNLYRSDYLPGLDMPWVIEKRDKLRNYFVHALIKLGENFEQRREFDDARTYYLRAIAAKPDREDVYRKAMTVNFMMGHHDQVHKLYKRLEHELRANLNIKPSQATKDLHDQYVG